MPYRGVVAGMQKMPESSYEVRKSWREQPRGRHIVAIVCGHDGRGVEGVAFRIEVDADGTFDDEAEVRQVEMVSKKLGYSFFTWWEWPPDSPPRDVTSVVRAVWETDGVSIYLDRDDG
jgi:hypothetical protein